MACTPGSFPATPWSWWRAYLTANTEELLARYRRNNATLQQRQQLATVIPSVRSGRGGRICARGSAPGAGEHCGDQDVAAYLAGVAAMTRLFSRLQAQDSAS
ncbi:MAG: hypothetical protein WDM77_17635 [Steroidobacteraceae bacterium]